MHEQQPIEQDEFFPRHLLEACTVTRAIALPGSFLVFLLYWSLAYPSTSGNVEAVGFFTHGANVALMTIDVLVSALPFPLYNAWYFVEFGFVYVVFTIIFWYAGITHPCSCPDGDDFPGCERNKENANDHCRYIYSALNWAPEKMPRTIGLLAVLFLVIIPISMLLCHYFALCCRPGQVSAHCCVHFRGEFNNEFLRPFPCGASSNWALLFAQSPLLSDRCYLLVRGILCAAVWAILAWVLADDGSKWWGIYLTYWTLAIEAVYMALALSATIIEQPYL